MASHSCGGRAGFGLTDEDLVRTTAAKVREARERLDREAYARTVEREAREAERAADAAVRGTSTAAGGIDVGVGNPFAFVTVNVRYGRGFALRKLIGIQLLQLAGKVLGCGVDARPEPEPETFEGFSARTIRDLEARILNGDRKPGDPEPAGIFGASLAEGTTDRRLEARGFAGSARKAREAALDRAGSDPRGIPLAAYMAERHQAEDVARLGSTAFAVVARCVPPEWYGRIRLFFGRDRDEVLAVAAESAERTKGYHVRLYARPDSPFSAAVWAGTIVAREVRRDGEALLVWDGAATPDLPRQFLDVPELVAVWISAE